MHLSLTYRARVASSELSVTEIKQKDSMAILIKKLDSIFLPDKGRRQFSVFNNMYSLRRDESENINIFVS